MDWLETYLAVVDLGGFTAASAQVHRSQSRVSAHIASLERELGAQLIDRSHRPARVTAAGEIFAQHARQILAEVGSARTAMSVVRSMSGESVSVVTTPCIGAAFLPGVFADLIGRHPGARLTLVEGGLADGLSGPQLDGVALAVAPTVAHPLPPGVQEQVLWREGVNLVLPPGHALAHEPATRPGALAGLPLVVAGAAAGGRPEMIDLLAGRGVAATAHILVDTVPTLVAMVRAGLGVGVLGSLAAEQVRSDDLAVVEVADPELVREVAAYWYPTLTATAVGRALREIVLGAAVPKGAVSPGVA